MRSWTLLSSPRRSAIYGILTVFLLVLVCLARKRKIRHESTKHSYAMVATVFMNARKGNAVADSLN